MTIMSGAQAARRDELVSVSQQLLDRTLTGADKASDNCVHNGCQRASSSSDWQISWLLSSWHVSTCPVYTGQCSGAAGVSRVCLRPNCWTEWGSGLDCLHRRRGAPSDSSSVQDSPGVSLTRDTLLTPHQRHGAAGHPSVAHFACAHQIKPTWQPELLNC